MLSQTWNTLRASLRWGAIRENNESLSIWNGSFAILSLNIVNGYVAMYLLDSLHATNSEMGLLNSLPSLVNLFAMLAAAVAIGRTRSKRIFCATATSVSRSFYVLIALVPWLPIANPAIWVVWLVALIRVPQSFGDLSWQALISDLISPSRRSAFFSERNRVTTSVGLLVTLLTGILLQQFDKHLRWPYQAVFLATAVFATLEIWVLLMHKEPIGLIKPSVPLLVKGFRRIRMNKLVALRQDKKFLAVGAALLFFNLAWQTAWPLFNIFQISTAHAPALWLGLFSVANQLTAIFTFRWWGRMADRFGNGRMMGIAALGMAISPILTVVSTNMWYQFFLNFVTGIPNAGTTLLLFNYLLEVCPESERTTYIAYYNVALSVVGFAAPELGIWFLGHIGMTGAMLVSTVLRFLAGLLFLVTTMVIGKRSRLQATSSLTM